jgi:diadenylate cyclase
MEKEERIDKKIGLAAINLANNVRADCIVSAERNQNSIQDSLVSVKVAVFRRKDDHSFAKNEYFTRLKASDFGQPLPMKELLLDALAHKLIQKQDRVVFVQDESLGSGFKSILAIFDADKMFFDISKQNIPSSINQEVLEAVLDIALELSKEGREGKKVGTAFVIGGEEVLNHTKQLVLNPFENREESILNKDLKETIKEYSQIDGAFIINGEGKIMSAGTYLTAKNPNLYLPVGFGTRHQSAAAMTSICDSVAVVISDSGGKVRIFNKGKLVFNL